MTGNRPWRIKLIALIKNYKILFFKFVVSIKQIPKKYMTEYKKLKKYMNHGTTTFQKITFFYKLVTARRDL
jgi:DNA-binding ferritin-like protein (Dps family)